MQDVVDELHSVIAPAFPPPSFPPATYTPAYILHAGVVVGHVQGSTPFSPTPHTPPVMYMWSSHTQPWRYRRASGGRLWPSSGSEGSGPVGSLPPARDTACHSMDSTDIRMTHGYGVVKG